MSDVRDFSNFIDAVIDEASFDDVKSYINYAKNSAGAEVIIGGGCDKSEGYFVEPTVILTTNPLFKSIREEIFGPVLTIFVYDDSKWEEVLQMFVTSSDYGLTGSIFSRNRAIINQSLDALRFSAGNFYINDKPTGAVVGQQPFGGARASGTNDKAGGPLNLVRWINLSNIKETFTPPYRVRLSIFRREVIIACIKNKGTLVNRLRYPYHISHSKVRPTLRPPIYSPHPLGRLRQAPP